MANESQVGSFVPLTQFYDIAEISKMDVSSPDFKEFLVRFRQYVNTIAIVLNAKDSGYYLPTEFVNGQLWFANPSLSDITPNSQAPTLRQDYRYVVNFGSLPNSGTKTVAHGITTDSALSATRIRAAATKNSASFSYIPIPYVSLSNENIEMHIDDTNVTIITESDRSAYTLCYVVFEYLRN